MTSLPDLHPQTRASSPSSYFFYSLFLSLSLLRQASGQPYRLLLVPKYSPPAVIPSDPNDYLYSVPLGQLTSRETFLRIQYLNGTKDVIFKKDHAVYVTSMDKSQKNPSDADAWRDSGGKLCQWTNPDLDKPMRLDRSSFSVTCGSSLRGTTLTVKIFKGKIYLDWLKHIHPAGELPPDNRFLRIEIPDLNLSVDTHPFKITEPAANLVITKQPPNNITANTKFDVAAEIHDRKGVRLTEGLDSVAYVDLTVSYVHKVFHHTYGKDMLLKSTKVRLSGSSVTTYEATKDCIIRQKAVAGRVSFTGIRILDIVTGLRLNLTMIMTGDPFLRIPNCKTCYDDIKYKEISKGLVRFKLPPLNVRKNIRSMNFTDKFDITPQLFAKFKNNIVRGTKVTITRNFPIPGPLETETLDVNGNRIYSGPDSDLDFNVTTLPMYVCLSHDYSFVSREGLASFKGSICEIRSSVYLVFHSNKNPKITIRSPEFEVVGRVHVGHFGHFKYTGAGDNVSPHVNSFIRFAATDLNSGEIPDVLLPYNMTIIVDTIETNNDISLALDQIRNLIKQSDHNPSTIIRTAILPKETEVSVALAKEMVHHKMMHISLDERREQFTDYRYFNRLCWNMKQIFNSFANFCRRRNWLEVIVLKTDSIDISRSLFYYARFERFEVHLETISDRSVQWDTKDPDSKKIISRTMAAVKNKKIKIIICFGTSTQLPIILNIALKEGLSFSEGYQWVFVSHYTWNFPFDNPPECPECTISFKGSIFFTDTYNTSAMRTPDWERVLFHYFTADKSIYFGLTPVYPNWYKGAQMALGYDAIWLYAKALAEIFSRKLTATSERVDNEIKRVTLHGLSGVLKLDEMGDREAFLADIRIINATELNEPFEKVAPLYKFIKYTEGMKEYIEYLYDNDESTDETMLPFRIPDSKYYNIHTFKSMTGRVRKYDIQHVQYMNETWPPIIIDRKERVIPPFTCNKSCGIEIISEENVNKYEEGECTIFGKCRCYEGYRGENCVRMECSCPRGYCRRPFKCVCFDGYTGAICNVTLCPGGCKHGICIEPFKCQCSPSFWVGRRCNVHLATILIPFLIILILLMYLAYTFIALCQRRLNRAAALLNIDWLVEWQDVIIQENYTSSRSSSYANSQGVMVNISYTWNNRKWFVKNIQSNTVDQNDENVRLEMAELIHLNHQNLIKYGGACLVSPNVCFLVERTQKGSLEDILPNKSIKLDWNFRFSFMKDICRGLNFLHYKTEIGSHGRLKSSNCLLDNRWCIRITDFGAPTIRYGPYMIEKIDFENSSDYFKMQDGLLWTAPELLETAFCLDDVRMGTKEGDVYSFAIVITEIATRALPFTYERTVLPTCTLIDLIVNQDDPIMERELEVWESMGSGDMNMVRPYINPEYLPEGVTERSKFLKMLETMWDHDPKARITFQKLTTVLDDIFPTRKELMDNLMHLLESYSKNLEKIVIERTDILETEKSKVENIVSQMLPKKVIEELKNGKVIQPENFECVTVYYSDIVGFTTIAMNSQPMEVVDLLNELYSLFDSILSQYDVYKVETIGDAYVVSSGVPTLNDNLHAGEIATASLDLMSAIMSKEVPHQNVKLQMRLGIHTGPVVAGVVGLKMPRYTLFGETMQIASIMESSSKPMHIQITEFTVNYLSQLGGYSTMYRHTTTVCGKNIDTYWLTGKEDYNKPLPQIVLEY